MQWYRLERTHAGDLSISGISMPLIGKDESAKPQTPDVLTTLSEVIQTFNERFGIDFPLSDADKMIIERWFVNLENDPILKRIAQENEFEDFLLLYETKLQEQMVGSPPSKLQELHGSLYWFRTESGKIIKVPMKGLTVRGLRYLSDEEVSEMMIYPALQKNKQSEVYLWLHETFTKELNKAATCVIIGYSFRDKDIVDNIIDALNRNLNLWLLIISPNASIYKNEHFNQNLELKSRVVIIPRKIEDVVTERKLNGYIQELNSVRGAEDTMWKKLFSSHIRDDSAIENTIKQYGHIGHTDYVQHEDRVKWINEKL